MLALACAAGGQETRPAELGAAKGSTIRYETRASSSEIMGELDSREAGNEVVRRFELTILDTTPEGGALIEYRCTSVRASFKAALGARFEVDSAHPSRPTEPTRHVLELLMLAEVGPPLVLTLDRRAHATSIRGVEALRGILDSESGISRELRQMVRPRFTDDHKRESLQAVVVQLPAPGWTVGTTWAPESGFHFCPGLGAECQKLALKSRVEALTASEIVITSASEAAESRKVEDYGRATQVRTRARVSRVDGLPIEIVTDLDSSWQIPVAEEKHRGSLRIHSTTTRLGDSVTDPAAESRSTSQRSR
jgi:hypothetical protein